ncbi:MAG: ATP-binding protein [Pseudomonadota bacterium]
MLVTIAAIAVSHIVAFALFANEREHAFRREAETRIVERIIDAAETIRDTPDTGEKVQRALALSNRGMRFYIVSDAPKGDSLGSAADIARAVSQQMHNSDVRGRTRIIQLRWRPRMRDIGGRDDPPPDEPRPHPVTQLTIDTRLDDAHWLRSTALMPAPRPVPNYLWIAALASMIAVGLGSALIALQISRPLADLANAARRFGLGDAKVSAPVTGPEDVRRASTAFNSMAERLGRQMTRQRQMLWALSHDLRTPITAIRLRAELIEDDTTRQRLLTPIAEMETLTEQALDLARAGASEEKRERVDIAEIARTLCGELQDMGVNAKAEADTPVFAECRPAEIARAMRNLAENAAKYAKGGVVKVYQGAGKETVIEIVDDGPGLPPELIGRVTEPFFRADEARSMHEEGAGLGLAIVQAIADSHGGGLELTNRHPHGLSAKLVLPAT